MRIKVIIKDGIVVDVLADGQADIEIVDIDKDYGDYEKLCEYERELYEGSSLKSVNFTVARFEEEEQ